MLAAMMVTVLSAVPQMKRSTPSSGLGVSQGWPADSSETGGGLGLRTHVVGEHSWDLARFYYCRDTGAEKSRCK